MLERRGEMQAQSQRGDLEHLEFLVPAAADRHENHAAHRHAW